MQHRVPILMYHNVNPLNSPISISPQTFEWQMRWLAENGCRATSFRDFINSQGEQGALPERTVALTFDDGFASLYEFACPVLTHYGFSATVFLVSDYAGRGNNWPNQPQGLPAYPLLNWDQIREMDRNGIDFGSHTRTHPRLDGLPASQLQSEIEESKAIIERQLGHAIDTFAYPYGRYDAAVKGTVAKAYYGACTTRLDFARSSDDPLEIPRIEISYFKHPRLFAELFSAFGSAYINIRRPLRKAATKVLGRTWQ